MQVAAIDANGSAGRELPPRPADAGHDPVGVIRDESQFEAARDRGDEPRLDDLEGDFESALDGAGAIVFTTGSGGSIGTDKTFMADLRGARRVIDACVEAGIGHFAMTSSTGVDDPLSGPEALRPYPVAKRCADDYLE